ncbi:hypothetical protein LMG29542_02873 [Paraburkholderia humisilvae]|uniref:Uncharacterized protein n=1 Tax=Paraburkholderia humisilvae TaxID=627669 RepID=A0A6J5DS80_9BURK|nr:hypothetical protein LMG29542_02873 [Paraburkholderia humisilvae]
MRPFARTMSEPSFRARRVACAPVPLDEQAYARAPIVGEAAASDHLHLADHAPIAFERARRDTRHVQRRVQVDVAA